MDVFDIKQLDFQKEVMLSKELVLLDFYASWCLPCKMLLPIMKEISKEYSGLKVFRVDIESEPELAQRFHVMSIPTLVYLKEGDIVEQSIGFQRKEEIEKTIQQLGISITE